MAEDIKFVAELSRVTEVSLLGTANFDYWQDRARPHGLSPVPRDGAAQILVIANGHKKLRTGEILGKNQ